MIHLPPQELYQLLQRERSQAQHRNRTPKPRKPKLPRRQR